MTNTDQQLLQFDFTETHRRWMAADQARVWRALLQLRLDQLTVTRPLVALRSLGRQAGHGQRPLLEAGPVRLLILDPPDYALGGAIGKPWQLTPTRRDVDSLAELAGFSEPGWVKYLVDFELKPSRGGTLVTTTTRIACTDDSARRRFGWYWLLIRAGSGMIRRDMLATLDRLTRRDLTVDQ